MCQAPPGSAVRERAQRLLENYRWRASGHELIFRILSRLASAMPEVLREELPAQLTRFGFPDFPWEKFFQPLSLSAEEVEHSLQQFLRSTRGQPSRRHEKPAR
jgi:hypothetical protein